MENILNIAAFVIFIFWIVTYWRGGTSVVKSLREAISPPDLVVLAVLTVLMAMIFLHAIYVLTGTREFLLPFWGRLMGGVLEIIGVTGMFYARSILGRFWTAQTVLRADHQVVDTSLYRVVRHPIYTAALVMIIGLGLVYSTALGIILTVLNLFGYFVKTVIEDRYLGENLPGYADYQTRVRFRLIPGIW